MRQMKETIFAIAVCIALCTGCMMPVMADDAGKDIVEDGQPFRIVVTVFAAYDWVCQITGAEPEGVEVTWLFDNGVDPHSYQPSVEDILTIASCDLFIYVGGVSDQWVEEALLSVPNPDLRVICLMDALKGKIREEELTEGMEAEHDHSVDEDPSLAGGETEYDEHVWLSLSNAELCCEEISKAMQEKDPVHADLYEKCTIEYLRQMEELNQSYEDAVMEATGDTLLFGDRFPFRYLTEDYGLNYYAAFSGCSAETEASFETIVFLAGKVDELGLPCVLTIDGSDQRIAETIVQSTKSKDQDIQRMDSMQSMTLEDVQSGASYIETMKENLEVVRAALDY